MLLSKRGYNNDLGSACILCSINHFCTHQSVRTAHCYCVPLTFTCFSTTAIFQLLCTNTHSYLSEPSIGVSVTERLYYRLYNLEPGYRLESYRVDSFLQQSVAALDARAVVPEVVIVTCVTAMK
jgi:hypothetical protein